MIAVNLDADLNANPVAAGHSDAKERVSRAGVKSTVRDETVLNTLRR